MCYRQVSDVLVLFVEARELRSNTAALSDRGEEQAPSEVRDPNPGKVNIRTLPKTREGCSRFI
jgi:hypothetical protein